MPYATYPIQIQYFFATIYTTQVTNFASQKSYFILVLFFVANLMKMISVKIMWRLELFKIQLKYGVVPMARLFVMVLATLDLYFVLNLNMGFCIRDLMIDQLESGHYQNHANQKMWQ